MFGDFSISLDLIAAVLTVLYLAKLLYQRRNNMNSGESFGVHCGASPRMRFSPDYVEKRSLLNQHVKRRITI